MSDLFSEASKIATERQRVHDAAGNNTERFFASDRAQENRIGVFGELQFEKEFGFKADRETRENGDGGIDFETPLGIIDVKTAQIPKYLLVKTGFIDRAAMYVLALFDEPTKSVVFLGWATKEEMRRCPKKDFGYGIMNYYKPAENLHAMDELKEKLGIKIEKKKLFEVPLRELPDYILRSALCGSFACGGCYDVGDGKQFHPPRADWDQKRLGKLDGDE